MHALVVKILGESVEDGKWHPPTEQDQPDEYIPSLEQLRSISDEVAQTLAECAACILALERMPEDEKITWELSVKAHHTLMNAQDLEEIAFKYRDARRTR